MSHKHHHVIIQDVDERQATVACFYDEGEAAAERWRQDQRIEREGKRDIVWVDRVREGNCTFRGVRG